MNAAVVIKDLLEAASVGVFNSQAVTDWNIRIDQDASTPDQMITIYNTGGHVPNPKFLIDYPSVQVRVRATAAGGANAAFNKVQEVKDALLGIDAQDIVATPGARLAGITGIGDIVNLGPDKNNRHEFVVNFQLFIHPPAGTGNRLPLD